MSEVRLVIRDAQRSIYADRHGSFAESVVAALSADPETIEELEVALERFIAPGQWGFFRRFYEGADDGPYDAGLMVVDLAARLVVCETTYCTVAHEGCVAYHDGVSATDVGVNYHLADEWLFMYDALDWQATAEKRREARLAHPRLDARAALYGEPLLAFIARECSATFPGHPAVEEGDHKHPAHSQEYDLVRKIHIDWMMTPREDLRGQTPRQVLMADEDHLGADHESRKHQWTHLERQPRELDSESAAYRFGGFHLHEIVVYYDMVRYLLWRCRERVVAGTQSGSVEGEVTHLTALREQWLDEPYSDFGVRTARSIIHKARSRIPEAVSGAEAMIDDDCPLCQLQAEMPGPTFWNMDGSGMDYDFAFCTWHDTYQEWEKEQRDWEEHHRRWEAEQEERKRLGVSESVGGYTDPGNVWQRSFTASASLGQSVFMRLFAIGSHLGELIVDLRAPTEQRDLIDRLGRAYGNLRQVAQSPDEAISDALIEPVLAGLAQALDSVAAARPDLADKCAALQEALRQFLEPPAPIEDEPDDPQGELDCPF